VRKQASARRRGHLTIEQIKYLVAYVMSPDNPVDK
jgi:hypothetical protein